MSERGRRYDGERVAVFGAGRSGVGAAQAIRAVGGTPVVVDEAEPTPEALQALASLGAETVGSWHGEFAETGCSLVVTSPGVCKRHPMLQQAVGEGLEVVSEIELAYRIAKAPLIAITGTNGKSTTTVMTWVCLQAAGIDAVLCGNISGSGYDEMPLTQAAAQSTPDQILVAEVSSFQLEWVSEFHPICAGITNISPDHLDRYQDFAEYAATKQRIFSRQEGGDTAVVRWNDPVVRPPSGPKVRRFGYGPPEPGQDAFSDEGAVCIDGERIGIENVPWVAEHDKLNAMMALLLAEGVGRADLAGLAKGLQGFRGLSHRMELVGSKGGVRVINNSMCTNPQAVESSSRSIQGRQHVLMGGINKDLGFTDLARCFQEAGHEAYLFGRDRQEIADQLEALEAPRKHVFETMAGAFEAAATMAHRGETIILSPGCASFDQFVDFRERGDLFRTIAQEWLGQ